MTTSLESIGITDVAENALMCEEATGVPAELTMAQWALESGWGVHQPGNNCFGIKSYPGCDGVQMLDTFEVVNGVRQRVKQAFATFRSLTSCFQKHASLLSGSSAYRKVWTEYQELKSVEKLIRGIAPIYATAPEYAETLLKIIAMERVKSALANARQERTSTHLPV